MGRRSCPLLGTFLVLGVALQVLSACSTPEPARRPEPQSKQIAQKFVGTWANENPGYQNWWVITPDKVVNYGVSQETGKCVTSEATILAPNQIDIPFGTTAKPYLYIAKDRLLFDAGGQRGIHVRVPRESICKQGKSYFEGAPYPSR